MKEQIIEWIDIRIRSAQNTAEEYIQELDNEGAAEKEFGKIEVLKELKLYINDLG